MPDTTGVDATLQVDRTVCPTFVSHTSVTEKDEDSDYKSNKIYIFLSVHRRTTLIEGILVNCRTSVGTPTI